jgi:short-subunit dehydrogenase
VTTTLITGASNGIGRALAERWAAEGHDLILTARSADRLEMLATELSAAHGIRATPVPADLSAADGPMHVLRTIDVAGYEIGTLINNAGVGLHGRFAETDLDRELAMIRLNVIASVALTKGVLVGMLERGRGAVVNVASVAAFAPGPYQSVYYATKAFVVSFSEALAAELADTGITVTAVCPGPTASGFHAAAEVHRDAGAYDRFLVPPRLVARATWSAVRRRRFLVVPGIRHRLLYTATRWLPRALLRRAARRTSRPTR